MERKFDREIAETRRTLASAKRRYDTNAIVSLQTELKRLKTAQDALYGFVSKAW